MFKLMISLTVLFTSLHLFANTIEQAENFYAQRGEDAVNANKAVAIYTTLAEAAGDEIAKGKLLIKASEAKYYFASRQTVKSIIKAEHKLGYKLATQAAGLLSSSFGVPVKDEVKEDLARAYYFYSGHFGKYALQKSKPWRLLNWKKMKKRLVAVRKLAIEVEDWGGNRIFGRSRQVLGSAKEGLGFLALAYASTLKSFPTEEGEKLISINSTNTYYYLDALKGNKKTEKFCEIYAIFSDFSAADDEIIAAHNPRLVPETLNTIEEFDNDEKMHNYATQCD